MDVASVERDLVAGGTSDACWLCALGEDRCDVTQIEGAPVTVGGYADKTHLPFVMLECSDGIRAGVLMPATARRLVAQLAAVPTAQRQRLTLRAFHLSLLPPRGGDVASGDEAPDLRLRASDRSVIVLEPDLLLSITDINSAEYCARQYPLRRMIPSPPTAATLKGTILHNAFKEMLKSGVADPREPLAHAIASAATDLALHNIDATELAAEAEPHVEALARWYELRRTSLWDSDTTPEMSAETFLLAPEVGLRGRLDFLLRDDVKGDALLELKTGAVRSSLPKREHRWQVYGYQTLLTVRHPQADHHPSARLLYSGTPGQAEDHGIPFSTRDLYHVLDLRNELALIHATGVVSAPPGPNKCAKCALRVECTGVSGLLGWQAPELGDTDADGSSSSPLDVAAEATWFARMSEALREEARAAEAQAAMLWRLFAQERMRLGIALGDLELAEPARRRPNGEWEYHFRCAQTSEMREGDAILVSDGDPVSGRVVSGSVLHLDSDGVTIWTPEPIESPRLLDRYSSDTVHDRTVRNLWRWLGVEPRLRAVVAGRHAPTFDQDIERQGAEHDCEQPSPYNKEQRRAIARGLAARDFLLIQGPPGTGKTSVLSALARRAVDRGERVLIAAFTNQAVDNALRRVVADGLDDVLRLGHEQSTSADLRQFRLAARAASGDPAALRSTLARTPLVAATTATWSAERYDDTGDLLRFDVAIIDEATQLTVPAILGALRFARRFVLVGDEHQLPPLVMSQGAAGDVLSRSLFQELLERWGDDALVALRHQYRMHPAICGFPSKAFYGGELEAAGVARTATLHIDLAAAPGLAPVLDPLRPVVFIDVPGAERGKTDRGQAQVCRDLVRALVRGNVPVDTIGIIAPYRAQVAAIRGQLSTSGLADVVVDTVDRFQGAERDVIIFSFGGQPDSATSLHGEDFVANRCRLNVALTRARRKLLLVGDRTALARMPLLADLVEYCEGLYGDKSGVITARARP